MASVKCARTWIIKQHRLGDILAASLLYSLLLADSFAVLICTLLLLCLHAIDADD